MQDILNHIPKDLINLVLIIVFSLLIGIEQRIHHSEAKEGNRFGTDRTFTLIGILSYVLYIISPSDKLFYILGFITLSVFLAINYFQKIQRFKHFGITSMLIALITYSFTALIYLFPIWLVLTIFVCILILTEIKEELFSFSQKFGNDEFLTLAKFIFISGIILPLLPHTNFIENIKLSPYQLWLAIVAVSAISYFSYLLQRFVFPDSGIMLTAILGGLYSSTATTIILARKSKEQTQDFVIVAAILAATSMMYLRLLLLALLFNKEIALKLFPFFIILAFITAGISYFLQKNKKMNKEEDTVNKHSNPLELKTAFVFGLLFAFFSVLTDFILKHYGDTGISYLSLIVGVTDIDPFILNLFQNGAETIGVSLIIKATLIATSGNNFIKMIYALSIGTPRYRKPLILSFSTIIVVGFLMILFV